MKIDSRKVNIAEKDLENYLFENPEVVKLYDDPVITEWVGRQFRVPSGIIDLLGVNKYNNLVVVEVKNVPFESCHLTQLARYAYDIQACQDKVEGPGYCPVWKFLIGPGDPDTQLMFEAQALDIVIFTLKYEITGRIASWAFTREFCDDYRTELDNISKNDFFSRLAMLKQASEVVEKATKKDEH